MPSLEAVQQVLGWAWVNARLAQKVYDVALSVYGFGPMHKAFFYACQALQEYAAVHRSDLHLLVRGMYYRD